MALGMPLRQRCLYLIEALILGLPAQANIGAGSFRRSQLDGAATASGSAPKKKIALTRKAGPVEELGLVRPFESRVSIVRTQA